MNWPKYVYFGVMALALLASLKGFKYKGYALFFPLLVLSFAVEIARDIYRHDAVITRYLSFFIAIEYALLALIISNFIHSETKRRIIRASIVILVPVFIFIRLVLVEKNKALQFLDLMIESPFLCAWTILYLFETVKQETEFEVTKNPMFWISLGNLLFFAGSFFSYGFGSYLESRGDTQMADIIFWIARVLNILLYILYFIGFLCLRMTKYYL